MKNWKKLPLIAYYSLLLSGFFTACRNPWMEKLLEPIAPKIVTYHINGGTGPTPPSQKVDAGDSVTLPSGNGFTKSGCTFGGWNTSASGTGTNYNAGSAYTPSQTVTLYALWEPATHIHEWNAWTQTKAPTETEEGEETRTCTLDPSHKETRPIAALNHTHIWGEWTETTAPTCTTAGEETIVCTLNADHYETRDIDALGHDSGAWHITLAATCTAAGTRELRCTRDNAVLVSNDTITALGHNWEWVVTKPPTQTEEGVETETCTHDAAHTRGTRPVPRIPITDVSAFDTWLTGQPPNNASNPYIVKVNITNNDMVTLRATLFDAPDKYVYLDLSGSTLTTIPNTAFYLYYDGCKTLTGITIPNGVGSIGNYAFNDCINLASVIIPDGVTSIGTGAFNGCTSLTSVNIPNNVNSIEEYAFNGCTSLTSVTIPNNVNSIEKYAFNGCTSLASVTIGNKVTNIGDGAFWYCASLTSITIPNSVTSIGEGAFEETGLTSVTFEGGTTTLNSATFYGLGDLNDKYLAANGGAGTYTRAENGAVWTKKP